MNNQRNYYRVLHTQPDAPPAVIKASYRTLMQTLKHHPDLGGDHWNAAIINEAYNTLSNPQKRAEYDKQFWGNIIKQRNHAHTQTQASPSSSAKLQYCLFCKTPYQLQTDTQCLLCHSPLQPIEAHNDNTSRSLSRINQDTPIQVYTHWPAEPKSGQLYDVSPEGAGIKLTAPIMINQVIKIDSDLFNAVAKIIRYEVTPTAFHAGIIFLSVDFKRKKGSFFSQSV